MLLPFLWVPWARELWCRKAGIHLGMGLDVCGKVLGLLLVWFSFPAQWKKMCNFLWDFSSYDFCSTRSTTNAKQLDLAAQRRQLDEELSRSWSDNREPSESYQEWALEALKWFIISHWSSVVETERKKCNATFRECKLMDKP